MEELAINGGQPVRKDKIYYGRQWVIQEDIDAVAKVLSSPLITCGPKVRELEKKLANYSEAMHAVVVSNGTAALHCACIAAGVQQGDEVITTPLTFAASSNCVLYCGGRPVFADINTRTFNIDPVSIESKITPKTKAIIAVDFTGQAVQIDDIRDICDRHQLVFIEDAAHSIGTKYKGKKIGHWADITTFSFHPVKTITCGEGGAILTNDEKLYNKLNLAHVHGITHDERFMEDTPHEGNWVYEQIMLGYNYRMTDFQAAMLMSQLSRIDALIARRKQIVKRYNDAFKNMPELILHEEIPESDTAKHLYIIRLNFERLRCSRKEFVYALGAENVEPQVHYVPVYWFPYYKHLGYKIGDCPNAEEIYKGILSIPLYPMLSDSDVDDVIHAVKKVVDYYKR